MRVNVICSVSTGAFGSSDRSGPNVISMCVRRPYRTYFVFRANSAEFLLHDMSTCLASECTYLGIACL